VIFPPESTRPYGIEVVDPDTFLQNVLDLYPDPTFEEILDQAASLRRPAQSVHEVLAALSRQAPNFAQSVFTGIATRDGGFGRTGAAVATELAFAALMKARRNGCTADLRQHILLVDNNLAAGFARNGGLGRLQALIDRLGPHMDAGRHLLSVFGSRPQDRDYEDLTQRGIGVAWVSAWNPTLEFRGSKLAQQLAPWLFIPE
jgi:hypothetical protein